MALSRDVVRLQTLRILKDLVLNARGSIITLRPCKIAYHICREELHRKCAVAVRNFLEELVDLGLIVVYKKSARGKIYAIFKHRYDNAELNVGNSPLFWKMLEHLSVEHINSLIVDLENRRIDITRIEMLLHAYG